MTELLTANQMRALESAAIESGKVTGLELMERAGQGVVDALCNNWPELAETAHRALVLCGPGNNGGDGFVIARLLADRGWQVDVFLYGKAEKLPPDARANHDRWIETGEAHQWDVDLILSGARPDVIVDAVFGIGLTRPLPGEVARVLDHHARESWKNWMRIRKVAVDCPSGLNLDNGHVPLEPDMEAPASEPPPGRSNIADLTVTFHTPKPGHYLELGPLMSRHLAVADIGLRGDAMERGIIGLPADPERARLTEPKHFGAAGLTALEPGTWPSSVLPKRRGGAHKYDFGHLIVFAGGVGRGGAGRMAARAGLRAGAGLVTLVCPKAALMENAMQLNAVMLRGLDDPNLLGEVADDRVSGFCLGPGLGVGTRTRALVQAALARKAGERDWRRPVVVLDADALTSFADDPETLFAEVHERTILTPHEGEFARLFPDLAEAVRGAKSKIDVVREAAARAGCVVLLKGADTVITNPEGAACLHAAAYDRAAPWLATAGAGDVLAGMIAGLAASPVSADLIVAAEAAVWLHVECARSFGPGLIAEDLPEELPKVLRALSL
ncbi:NAD(P)H-hydrate dehydratase [Roseobacter sp. YSTF-M11]|uniref:Bifunctional NAD(P)H-hydrate repair enzyme n=1 Tax=Roseobacter insulae TaxID=2859783 RepID=A0A9X1JYT1_9RHOB|nr:NAD(P)H-hydrate dehydratase [Roseobacter insulae]MBW4708510.1 NAD(P)H-hydrate dehydratase [Roseobacter insulae]